MTTEKKLFSDYNIDETLQSNSFVISLADYYEQNGNLTSGQLNALNDILGKDELFEPHKKQEIQVYKKYFFRADYHGDYLEDYSLIYTADGSDIDLTSTIQDLHALQYSSEKYVEQYKFVKTIEIPEGILNVQYWCNFFYEDFQKIEDKLLRDKFRTTKSKNRTIRAYRSFIEREPNEELIAKVSGSYYNYNKRH